MTIAQIDARALPRPIRRGLGRIDRRIRLLALLRGSGIALLILGLISAAGMAADFFLVLPPAVRWGIWIGWISAGSIALLVAGIVPLLRRRNWSDLAAVAESGQPELGERLAGAVDLLGRGGRSHGSPLMIAALADQASEKAGSLDLGRAVSARGAAAWMSLGLVVAAMVAAPSFARPDPFATLGRRFLSPWEMIGRVGRFVVEVTPGDAVVAVGSDVAFVATVRPRVGGVGESEAAWLVWAEADGARHRARMLADEAGTPAARTFRLTLPRLARSISYRVAADSSASRDYALSAVAPPSVAKVSARVEPPAYTKLKPSLAKDAARIEAWEGSSIALTLTPSKPLVAAVVAWPSAVEGADEGGYGRDASKSIAMASPDGGKTWTATAPAEFSGAYSFKLEDEHHLTNRPEPPRRLVVRPDAAPTIALGGTGEARDAQGDDLLVLDGLAHDDLAVAGAEIVYEIEKAGTPGTREGSSRLAFEGLGTRSASGEVALNLKPLELAEGDRLTYRVKVSDSLPPPRGPNVTFSGPRTLKIVGKAEPLIARDRSAERESLQEQLTALKKLAAENRQGAQALRYAADAAQRGNGAWDGSRQDELARRGASAKDVVDKLNVLARDFAESDQYAPLTRPTKQIAELEAEAGRETLDQARKADDPAARLAVLRLADDRLAAVQTRLEELQARFSELSKLDDERRRLRQLAEKEEELADRAQEASKDGDREAMDRLRQEQERLRNELDEITRRSPELRAEALAARAREAEGLAKKARELAEKQREEARLTADPRSREAKLKALAEAQKQLEDDGRRLAMKVDRPLEENGRAHLDANALARPIDPIEKGEIEPGRQRLEEAEDALRRLARDMEDVRDDPKALARRLARRQEVLNEHTNEVLRDNRDPDQKAALAEMLKPLARRQQAIARLAAAIPVPKSAENQGQEATRATARAGDTLKSNGVDQAQNHQNQARESLHRLADALPDAWQRRQQAREALNEARQRTEQVGRDLDNALRETARRPDANFDPEAAARELARRAANLADRQAEAVRNLADMPPDAQARPQQGRALNRARDLADALDALRDAASGEATKAESKAPADWRILGPFEGPKARAPFAVERAIDFKAAHEGRKKKPILWRPVASAQGGRIDLGALFSRDDNQTAFGMTEIQSPGAGRGRLIIGSDDNCTIWLNGKKVYEFDGSRSWGAETDRASVEFAAGANVLVVRCGNGNGEWQYSVSAELPRTSEVARVIERVEKLRDALPAARADAMAAIDRLDEKIQGREPADDRAAEIAAEMKADPPAAGAMRRQAAALRNLKVPDAPAEQAEAVRLAEKADKAQAENRPDADETRQGAIQAAIDLAGRLADELTPRQQAAALARAEKGLNQPDAARDRQAMAKAQAAIAAEVAALPAPDPAKKAAVEATKRAAEMAEQQVNRPDVAATPEQMDAARDEAARALEALAKADLPDPAPADKPNAEAPPRRQAEELAHRQEAIAREAEELGKKAEAAKDDKAARAKIAADLAALAHRQEAVAEAHREVADPLPARSGERREAEKRRDEVRSAQARAAAALANHDPRRAAEMAKQAAEAGTRLAQALPDKNPDPRQAGATPDDPELGVKPDQVEAARDLVRRERQIKEQVQAILGERIAPQEKLRDESAALGQQMAQLRDAARDISPRSHGAANASAELLRNHAPQAMNMADEHLAAGRPDPARDLQRRTAELLQQAANHAEDVAAALKADAGQAQAEAQAEGKADLAAARDAQRDAGRQLAQAHDAKGEAAANASTKAASASMKQAAQGLRQAARSRGSRPSRVAQDGPSNSEPKGDEAGKADPHLAELQEAIKARTGRNWGELPGHLRTEILQMSQGRYRDDYARLIGLYFREIAAGKDATGGKNP